MQYDIVVVTYLGEWNIFRLQAYSFKKYMEMANVKSIVIVANDIDSAKEIELIKKIESLYYHELHFGADFVKIIGGSRLLGDININNGYITQQILKLRISSLVDSTHYVVFDSKNFLINYTDRSYFFSNQKPVARFEDFTDWRSKCIEDYYDIFEIAPERRVRNLPATMTPFIFIREEVVRMLVAIEQKNNVSLNTIFETIECSEFLLYAVYLEAAGHSVRDLYAEVYLPSKTLWAGYDQGNGGFISAFREARDAKINVIGLHRHRIAQMNQQEHTELARILSDLGLPQLVG